jgi:hypothetical protein
MHDENWNPDGRYRVQGKFAKAPKGAIRPQLKTKAEIEWALTTGTSTLIRASEGT